MQPVQDAPSLVSFADHPGLDRFALGRHFEGELVIHFFNIEESRRFEEAVRYRSARLGAPSCAPIDAQAEESRVADARRTFPLPLSQPESAEPPVTARSSVASLSLRAPSSLAPAGKPASKELSDEEFSFTEAGTAQGGRLRKPRGRGAKQPRRTRGKGDGSAGHSSLAPNQSSEDPAHSASVPLAARRTKDATPGLPTDESQVLAVVGPETLSSAPLRSKRSRDDTSLSRAPRTRRPTGGALTRGVGSGTSGECENAAADLCPETVSGVSCACRSSAAESEDSEGGSAEAGDREGYSGRDRHARRHSGQEQDAPIADAEELDGESETELPPRSGLRDMVSRVIAAVAAAGASRARAAPTSRAGTDITSATDTRSRGTSPGSARRNVQDGPESARVRPYDAATRASPLRERGGDEWTARLLSRLGGREAEPRPATPAGERTASREIDSPAVGAASDTRAWAARRSVKHPEKRAGGEDERPSAYSERGHGLADGPHGGVEASPRTPSMRTPTSVSGPRKGAEDPTVAQIVSLLQQLQSARHTKMRERIEVLRSDATEGFRAEAERRIDELCRYGIAGWDRSLCARSALGATRSLFHAPLFFFFFLAGSHSRSGRSTQPPSSKFVHASSRNSKISGSGRPRVRPRRRAGAGASSRYDGFRRPHRGRRFAEPCLTRSLEPKRSLLHAASAGGGRDEVLGRRVRRRDSIHGDSDVPRAPRPGAVPCRSNQSRHRGCPEPGSRRGRAPGRGLQAPGRDPRLSSSDRFLLRAKAAATRILGQRTGCAKDGSQSVNTMAWAEEE